MHRSDDKALFLRRHGLLHPRPQAVLDPLFRDNGCFDPRDLVLVKVEMLRCVRIEQATVREATCRFGFSRPVFYQAQKQFDALGLPGLIPKSRGPRHPHKLSGDVVRFLQRQVVEQPALGAGDLVEPVRQRFGVSLHPQSIERALQRSRQKKGRGTVPTAMKS